MSQKESTRLLTQPLTAAGFALLNWTTPQQQLRSLVDNPGPNFVEWETFRDTKCRKWVTLNVTCGLILGAIGTILFSNYPLSRAAFVLGTMSLLSGLIATSLGVGLIYALGDLKGSQYQSLMSRHPILFAVALVLPQTWTFICFATFYLACAVCLWDAVDKSWFVKAGVAFSIFAITIHLAGFFYAIRTPGELVEASDSKPLTSKKDIARRQGIPVRVEVPPGDGQS